jgi:hypothetical protein
LRTTVDASSILAAADARLDDDNVQRATLAPQRRRAHTLVELAGLLPVDDAGDPFAIAWAEAMAGVALGMHAAFPDNLLWDLDYLGAVLWAGRTGPEPVAEVRHRGEQIARVQARFGRATAIAFRYVHDFSYGFDWAKWVGRDPAARAEVGPFDPAFVAAMLQRADELDEVIANDTDAKYPPLPDDRPRNPFGFSREPADELRLLLRLAADDALPVQAWRLDARPVWDRPYGALRRAAAADLGL